MSFEEETARRYREHAEELRVIADYDRLEETKRKLLGVARDYDKMAEDMEAIAEWRRYLEKHKKSD